MWLERKTIGIYFLLPFGLRAPPLPEQEHICPYVQKKLQFFRVEIQNRRIIPFLSSSGHKNGIVCPLRQPVRTAWAVIWQVFLPKISSEYEYFLWKVRVSTSIYSSIYEYLSSISRGGVCFSPNKFYNYTIKNSVLEHKCSSKSSEKFCICFQEATFRKPNACRVL